MSGYWLVGLFLVMSTKNFLISPSLGLLAADSSTCFFSQALSCTESGSLGAETNRSSAFPFQRPSASWTAHTGTNCLEHGVF